METYPSIFNDVLGPVMRGPSSSHCAAALRIGRLCRDLMDGAMRHVHIEFDPNGSLATTHDGQGSDMGLFGGFLGWEAYDERLPESEQHLSQAGMEVRIDINDIGADHPNTYKITLTNDKEVHILTAISTGGGMIEVIAIDGAAISMAGDYFETIFFVKEPAAVMAFLEASMVYDELLVHHGASTFIQVKAQEFPDTSLINELAAMPDVLMIKRLNPVLPVLSRKGLQVPFQSVREMQEYNKDKNKELWELAVLYESNRGNISEEKVLSEMSRILDIMKNSIQTGLKGTEYKDRLLGPQSVEFKSKMDSRQLIEGDLMNRIIMYVSAIMEVKSSMGVIVAAPTAGSCGALPGAVIAMGDALHLEGEVLVKGMLVAGLIGVFIATHATFAAEVGGCQAECGSGACMAAAAMVSMKGGSLDQSLSAASLALQNSLGMICDPIANRVEAPCLGKNVMAATNAFSCANMALANYNHLIPLDEVIDTMYQVGNSMPHALRCTTLGGLSITKTAKELEQSLLNQQSVFKSC